MAAPFFHEPLRLFARWLFAVYHDIRVEGAEHVPSQGPAIVAANHPTYLDPAFLMLGVQRPIRFMAWEKPFRVPGLGLLLRAYGSIPVRTRKPGKTSFEEAVRVLRRGEVFGIFPEGGRTKGLNQMNPFKSGVARLALITGAPIIPATIRGGRRVWRRGELIPKPGPIVVRFHPPIRIPATERLRWRRDKSLERELIYELMATIHHSLAPSLRKEERVDRLLEGPAPPASLGVEGIPVLVGALTPFLMSHKTWAHAGRPVLEWTAVYVAFLFLDLLLETRGWAVIWLRNLLPWGALVVLGHRTLGWPGPAWLGLEAAVLAALVWVQIFRFPLYRRLRTGLLIVAYGAWLVFCSR